MEQLITCRVYLVFCTHTYFENKLNKLMRNLGSFLLLHASVAHNVLCKLSFVSVFN